MSSRPIHDPWHGAQLAPAGDPLHQRVDGNKEPQKTQKNAKYDADRQAKSGSSFFCVFLRFLRPSLLFEHVSIPTARGLVLLLAEPGAVRPMALGFKTDEIKRLISLDEAGMR
jgi:hypothetical protein